MLDFLEANSSAVFALAGAIVGALATFLTSWVMARRELKMRMAEKLLDRRMEAYDSILALAKEMRGMVSLEEMEGPGELSRAPAVMFSDEHFTDWQARLGVVGAAASHWLHPDLFRELSLLQDYVVNLHITMQGTSSEAYPQVGALIRQDFIDFSSALEDRAMTFYRDDVRKVRSLPKAEWHKYPVEVTTERLNETQLKKRSSEIDDVLARDANN